MSEERWVPKPGYEGWYEVSDHGRTRKIRRSATGPRNEAKSQFPIILARLLYKKGYFKCHFGSCDGTKPIKRMYLHRCVWEAFRGPIPAGMTVNHIDGDKANNRLDNLELLTNAENSEHAFRIGLKKRKMMPEEGRQVRDLYRTGHWTMDDLAALFGVSQSMISALVVKRPWNMLSDRWFT